MVLVFFAFAGDVAVVIVVVCVLFHLHSHHHIIKHITAMNRLVCAMNNERRRQTKRSISKKIEKLFGDLTL